MDLEFVELLAIAIAPVIFIMTYVYLKDEYEREPLKYLVVTFVLGALTPVGVLWLSPYMQALTGTTNPGDDPFLLLIYAFVVVAMLEEGFKYAVLRWYNYPHKEFDEPYDGIMYGVAVSLGFACAENIMYVFSAESGLETGLMRMFTAVPAHAAFGVMMGYFVGQAKFLHGKGHPFLTRLKGLGTAILFHGLYDYFLFLNRAYVVSLAFIALYVGIWLARRAMKLHAENSPHKENSETWEG